MRKRRIQKHEEQANVQRTLEMSDNVLIMLERYGNTIIGNKQFKEFGEEKIIEYFKAKGIECRIKKVAHENNDVNYIIEVINQK